MRRNQPLTYSGAKGADQMQAIHQAVKAALTTSLPYHLLHIFLWLCDHRLCDRILMLSNPIDLDLTHEVHALFDTHLHTNAYTLNIHTFDRRWPETPSKVELWNMAQELDQLVVEPLPSSLSNPKQTMWSHIHMDYSSFPKPSHIACDEPSDPTPLPAI